MMPASMKSVTPSCHTHCLAIAIPIPIYHLHLGTLLNEQLRGSSYLLRWGGVRAAPYQMHENDPLSQQDELIKMHLAF